MYAKIIQLAKVTLEEIQTDQTFLTTSEETTSTKRLQGMIKNETAKQDSHSLIESFKCERNVIANAKRLGIFSQKNSAFVKKCDRFIKVANQELNKYESYLHQLPVDIQLYILSFLDAVEIESIKETCTTFYNFSKHKQLTTAPLKFNLDDISVLGEGTISNSMLLTTVIFIAKTKIALAAGKQIALLDLKKFNIIKRFKGHEHQINTIAVDQTKQLLFSGGNDETIRVWDLNQNECVETKVVNSKIRCMHYLNGRLLIGTSEDEIMIWDYPKQIQSIENAHSNGSGINCVLNYPGSQKFVSYSESTVKVWGPSLQCLAELKMEKTIRSMDLYPRFNAILVGYNNVIKALSMSDLTELATFVHPENCQVEKIKSFLNDTMLVTWDNCKLSVVEQLDIRKQSFTIQSTSIRSDSLTINIAFNPNTGETILLSVKSFDYLRFTTIHRPSMNSIIKNLDELIQKVDPDLKWVYWSTEKMFCLTILKDDHLIKAKELIYELGIQKNCTIGTKNNMNFIRVHIGNNAWLKQFAKTLEQYIGSNNNNHKEAVLPSNELEVEQPSSLGPR